jgi:hypothetical protein
LPYCRRGEEGERRQRNRQRLVFGRLHAYKPQSAALLPPGAATQRALTHASLALQQHKALLGVPAYSKKTWPQPTQMRPTRSASSSMTR